jgi:hypothetical protein
VIDLAVVLSFRSFVLEILVGASGYGVNGSEGQKIGVLLEGFCGSWRWWKFIRFWLWLDYLGVLCRLGYLKWRRGAGDGRLSGMSLAHVWSVVICVIPRFYAKIKYSLYTCPRLIVPHIRIKSAHR